MAQKCTNTQLKLALGITDSSKDKECETAVENYEQKQGVSRGDISLDNLQGDIKSVAKQQAKVELDRKNVLQPAFLTFLRNFQHSCHVSVSCSSRSTKSSMSSACKTSPADRNLKISLANLELSNVCL
mmetsp:Transcript_16896/g.38477  ORF Transcript_16896/g.38477 Transcript_16896/m.38477 type:complete len:128 (+) Transcript_16896:95-478(+)